MSKKLSLIIGLVVCIMGLTIFLYPTNKDGLVEVLPKGLKIELSKDDLKSKIVKDMNKIEQERKD
jgi:tRNA 2-selenouridine synthase SelU